MEQHSIAFYTEAGISRGMGHLVRCYTIKEEFQRNNYLIDFYLDSDINFDYKFENLNYFQWNNIKKKNYDIIIIDSYLASLDTYNNLSKRCTLLVCIDDYNRLNYPKSVIINFAPDSQLLFFQEQKIGYYYLLGLDYIPIRQKLLESNISKKNQIFIMLGGMDTANLSTQILNSINKIDMKKVIVINDKVTAIKLKKIQNVKVLHKPSDDELIEHMANSSLSISTASMTLYELSYLRIPTIAIALNKNQQIGIEQSIKHKIVFSQCNIKEKFWEKSLLQKVREINSSIITNNIIDGQGTQRILKKIQKRINQ